MPAQPLSNVKSAARVIIGPEAAKLYPELAALVGEIIASWSQVELAFSELLIAMLGADAAPYVEMHKDIISAPAKIATIKAAARVVLSKHAQLLFDNICKTRSSISKSRNDLAHWPWAYSPDIPDAILLCDPKSLMDYTLANIDEYLGLPSSGIIGSHSEHPSLHAGAPPFDNSTIYVYREADLIQIKKDIWGLHSELTVFHVALIGQDLPEWYETMRQMLSGEYQTWTEQFQPHTGRQTTPPKHQRPRRSKRRGK